MLKEAEVAFVRRHLLEVHDCSFVLEVHDCSWCPKNKKIIYSRQLQGSSSHGIRIKFRIFAFCVAFPLSHGINLLINGINRLLIAFVSLSMAFSINQ